MLHAFHFFLPFLATGFAVLAACLKALAVGLPLAPAFFIVSPEPALMRFFFAAMFLYRLMLIPHHFVFADQNAALVLPFAMFLA